MLEANTFFPQSSCSVTCVSIAQFIQNESGYQVTAF